jgi:hypothetical protein
LGHNELSAPVHHGCLELNQLARIYAFKEQDYCHDRCDGAASHQGAHWIESQLAQYQS